MPSRTETSAASSPAQNAGATGTAVWWSEACGSDPSATYTVPTKARTVADSAPVRTLARWARPGPVAAAAQARAAGGSPVTQSRHSQAARGSGPIAANPYESRTGPPGCTPTARKAAYSRTGGSQRCDLRSRAEW